MLQTLAHSHSESRDRVLANSGVDVIVQALLSYPDSHKLIQHASLALEHLGLPEHPNDETATQRAAKALEQARARWPK